MQTTVLLYFNDFIHIILVATDVMANWDSRDELWDTTPAFQTPFEREMEKSTMSRYSQKYSINLCRMQTLCKSIFKFISNKRSLLISEISLSMRMCLLEYIVHTESPFYSDKTLLIHVMDFLPTNLTSNLDFTYCSLFEGSLANFSIAKRKKIFLVSHSSYSYLENEVLPALRNEKVLFIYLGNDLFKSSPMPGFKQAQNIILTSNLLANNASQSPYPFTHIYWDELSNLCIKHYSTGQDTGERSSLTNDQHSPLTPKPTLPTTDRLLERLAIKHNATQYLNELEYLVGIVYECLERRASVAVDRSNLTILTCLLDYVIMKRVERATGLRTIVVYPNSLSEEIKSLETMSLHCDINYVRRVMFLSMHNIRDYNSTLHDGCLLVSYTKKGDNFHDVSLFDGPFLSLSPKEINKNNLSKVSRPFLYIQHFGNDITCRPWNGFIWDILGTERVEMPDQYTFEKDGSNSREGLLTRITQKFNCDLKFTSMLCSCLSDFIENGESVIVDSFSFEQLACLLDFVIASRIKNTARPKTIIFCDTNLCSTLSQLDVSHSNLCLVLHSKNPAHSNRSVLFLNDMIENNFYQKLNNPKWITPSYLLIEYSYQTTQLNLMFSHTNCQILCLSVTAAERSIQDLIQKPYINMRHTGQNEFETNDFRYEIPTPLSFVNTIPADIPIYHPDRENDNNGYKETSHPEQLPIYKPKDTSTGHLLDRLATKHIVISYKSVLEYIIGITLNCAEMGVSLVVDGCNPSLINCLLDYIVTTRANNATPLYTIVDHSNSSSSVIESLDIVKTKHYARVRNSIIFPEKTNVLFSCLKSSVSHLLGTLSDDCLFILYSKTGYKFDYLPLVSCSFLALSTVKLGEYYLSKIDNRPLLHVRYEELTHDVICKPRYVIGDNKSICPIERRFDTELKAGEVLSPTHESALDVSTVPIESEQSKSFPSQMNESNSQDNLLPRLTTKFNCDLKFTSNLCTAMTDFLYQGKSVIIDKFPLNQLACLVDFIIADRTTNGSNLQILIHCSKKVFKSTLRHLEAVLCNDYQILDAGLNFTSDTRVVIWHFESKDFYKQLNGCLKSDQSYLFVKFGRKGCSVSLPFSCINCQMLSLVEGGVKKSKLKSIRRPFTHIRYYSKTYFEINDSSYYKLPSITNPPKKPVNEPERHRREDQLDYRQQNFPLPEIGNSKINPLFLHTQNPVANLINQLFNKHNIKVLTELPSDLYNTMYTLLLERRNVAVDGLSVCYTSELVSIYALECKSMDTPVSICYGRYIIRLVSHFQSLPVIRIDSIVQTLTTNTDRRHLWLFIGLDNEILSQLIPLIKTTHQCILLFNLGSPFMLDQKDLAITRLYKQFDSIYIRSYNEHLFDLLPKDAGTLLPESLETNHIATSGHVVATHTQSDTPSDTIPTIYTENITHNESENQSIEKLIILNETDANCISMIEVETVSENPSTDLIESVFSSLQDNNKQANPFPSKSSGFVTENAQTKLGADITSNHLYSNKQIPISCNSGYDVETDKLTLSNLCETENRGDNAIPILSSPDNINLTHPENMNYLIDTNKDLVTSTVAINSTTIESNLLSGDLFSEFESIKSLLNTSADSDHIITTEALKQNMQWTSDLIAEQVTNELSEIYSLLEELPETDFQIRIEQASTPKMDAIDSPISNSQPLSPLGITSTLSETEQDTHIIQQAGPNLPTTEHTTELPLPIEIPMPLPETTISESHPIPVYSSHSNISPTTEADRETGYKPEALSITKLELEENTNTMIDSEINFSELLPPNQHITTDLITEQISSEISEIYSFVEIPMLLPETDSQIRVKQANIPKMESIDSSISNSQPLSPLGDTSSLSETEQDTHIFEQAGPNLPTTETTISEFHPIPVSNSDSNISLTTAADTEIGYNPEALSITKLELEESTNTMVDSETNFSDQHITTDLITEQVSNEVSELSDKAASPSELGLHLITSPLQSGIHTVLFSSDAIYYSHILCHIASVLDSITHSLQVVITSHSPEICSHLLSLASSHLHTGTNGFLFKTGPTDQLYNYIVKQKVQILSIPVTPLTSLIQSYPSLFAKNKILVYIEGNKPSSIKSLNLEMLTKNIAKQCIFILPASKSFSIFLDSFPTPNCEIQFQQISPEIERYSVEFNFDSV